MKAETVFAHELSLIRDKAIKDFILEVFNKLCPDYFWTCPCSTSGKYHPQVSLGEGGLVRHTKLAVWWGIELLRALDKEICRLSQGKPQDHVSPQQLQDEVIATLLLHDMIKNGKGLGLDGRPFDCNVTGTHGIVLARKIHNLINGALDVIIRGRIIYGISEHMGIWTVGSLYESRSGHTVEPNLVTKAFAQLIHLADYCASRKVDEIYATLQSEKTE